MVRKIKLVIVIKIVCIYRENLFYTKSNFEREFAYINGISEN